MMLDRFSVRGTILTMLRGSASPTSFPICRGSAAITNRGRCPVGFDLARLDKSVHFGTRDNVDEEFEAVET